MRKPGFPEKVKVDASTSPLFPVGSQVLFCRLEPGGSRARIFLKKEGQEPRFLFEKDLPDEPPPGKDLSVGDKISGENGNKQLQLLITVCPGRAPELITKYLVGQVSDPSDIDPGGTGVWVAEAGPPLQEE